MSFRVRLNPDAAWQPCPNKSSLHIFCIRYAKENMPSGTFDVNAMFADFTAEEWTRDGTTRDITDEVRAHVVETTKKWVEQKFKARIVSAKKELALYNRYTEENKTKWLNELPEVVYSALDLE